MLLQVKELVIIANARKCFNKAGAVVVATEKRNRSVCPSISQGWLPRNQFPWSTLMRCFPSNQLIL